MKKNIILGLLFVLCAFVNPSKIHADPTSHSLQHVVDKTLPAVVCILIKQNSFDLSYEMDPTSYYEYLRPLYEWWWPTKVGNGSGFIISSDGYLVTNYHVIQDTTDLLVVMQGAEHRIYRASVVGSDPFMDIAVLKIEDAEGETFPYLKFGDSNKTKIGETAFAVGTPLDEIFEATVTAGIISGKDRNFGPTEFDGYLQTDVPLNQGNSGGPLLNLNGEVIGVSAWGVPVELGFQGLSCAIPSNIAAPLANQIIKNGEVSHGYLGASLELDGEIGFDCYFFESYAGAKVLETYKNSPARKAGLKEGDVIIELNGNPVVSARNFFHQLYVLEPRAKIFLKVKRGDEILHFSIVLGE